MKFSRPSPAMVVAVLALIVALSGTSMAATGFSVISGSRIKPHSITAKELAVGAVTHRALASKAVQADNVGELTYSICKNPHQDLVGTTGGCARSGPGTHQAPPLVCPNGSPLPQDGQCASSTYTQAVSPIVEATTHSLKMTCPDGTASTLTSPCPAASIGSVASSRVTIPTGGAIASYFAAPTGTSTATLQPSSTVVFASPATPITLTNLSVQIVGAPSSRWPTVLTVGVVVNGYQSNLYCSMSPVPGPGNKCTSTGSVTIPANSTYSLYFVVNSTNLSNSDIWDEFAVSAGYTTTIS